MGFKESSYAKIWEVENKGNYTVVSLSTSKKNKQTEKYETDFSFKFVRFIGTAHTLAATLKKDDKIKIGNCEVTNNYDKEKKITYTNYLVYSYELANDANGSPKANTTPSKPAVTPVDNSVADEDLPF